MDRKEDRTEMEGHSSARGSRKGTMLKAVVLAALMIVLAVIEVRYLGYDEDAAQSGPGTAETKDGEEK